ncbi:hypothetical protein PTSG_09783 [Salpingoeca rosetta]|uniref:Tubby C-terminal domain-containing protein n=1 Tax=Salpingoeca rosetta (strain ATCC 50818 / BSB-021) TaxID=946362 RepID=F2UP18_SALR5|nr:uncharacterized protein PTSG_09783 [Salpingoeca rosetta]EGD79373.1 hypothetical protein PTSG_09783 [Salpingoeca rosetta]|eukprot:XP_004989142.1 hypothetical protein PTSG_09783 [Salpingoeca rosetta]
MGNWGSRERDGPAGRELTSSTHYFMHLALTPATAKSHQLQLHQQQQQHGVEDGMRATLSSSATSSPASSLSRPGRPLPPLPQRSSSPSMESMSMMSMMSVSTTRSSAISDVSTFELYRAPVACVGGSFRPGASIDPMRETPYFDVRPHHQEVHVPTSESHMHVDKVSYFMLEPHPGCRIALKKAKIVLPLTPSPCFAIVVQSNTYTTNVRREGRAMHVELMKPNGDCIMYARFYTLRDPSASSLSLPLPGTRRSSTSSSGGRGGGGGDGPRKHRHTFEVRTTQESVLLARAQGHIQRGFDVLVSDFVTADHPMYSVVLAFLITVLLCKMHTRPTRRQQRRLQQQQQKEHQQQQQQRLAEEGKRRPSQPQPSTDEQGQDDARLQRHGSHISTASSMAESAD